MMDDYKTQFGRASPSLYTGIPYNALTIIEYSTVK